MFSDAWLTPILLRLERLDLDVMYHEELTHPEVSHRETAARAFENLDRNWKDDEVRRWWEKTRADLAGSR